MPSSTSPRRCAPASAMAGLVAVCLSAAFLTAVAQAPDDAEWSQWRGPNRDGVSPETDILRTWPEAGPTEVWRVPLGPGFSAMAIVGSRLYTLLSTGEDEVTVCLNVEDGSEIWRTKTGPRYDNSRGNGPRSTPTIHDGKAYVMSSTGTLFALDAENGDILWRHDFVEEFGATAPGWGYSCSPLVEGGLVMVEAGGPSDNALVACDRATGEIAWTADSGEAGYSSPIAVTSGGRRQVLFLTMRALLSVAPSDGSVLWYYDWPGTNIATPLLVGDDLVFVSASYDKGAAVVRMTGEGDDVDVERVWASREMRNHFNSSVLFGDHVYGFDNANFKCIEAATGDEMWSHRRELGKGSLIRVGDRLIVLSEGGTLLLVDATPEEYRELSRVNILRGRTWTPPCLANGQLYLRNETEILRLDVAAAD